MKENATVKTGKAIFELRGDTYPYKESFKQAGCRWDKDARCWTARSREQAEKAVAIAGNPFSVAIEERGIISPESGIDRTQPAANVAAVADSGRRTAQASATVAEPVKSGVNWSDEQLAIFSFFREGKGNLVVRARAGTGKTFTITHGVVQAPEQEILYCVFNRRNAVEAEGKIVDPRVTVATLHKVGYRVVRQYWPNARPDNDVDRDRIAAASPTTPPDEVVAAIGKLVGFAKNTTISLPSIEQLADLAEDKGIFAGAWEEQEQGGWTVSKLASVARGAMELAMKKDAQGRISFDDMVWLPVAMQWVTPQFGLVVVDECFPAGTLVRMADGSLKPIELIVPGESVFNASGIGEVSKLWRKNTSELICVKHEIGSFVCTPNHPILTQKGWIKACGLNETHYIKTHEQTMRMVQEYNAGNYSTRQEEAFLQSILLGEMENESTWNVGKGSQRCQCSKNQLEPAGKLFQESKSRNGIIISNARSKPNEDYVGSETGIGYTSGNWSSSENKRGQRNWTNESGISFDGEFSRCEKQLCCQNREGKGVSEPLQNRHSISRLHGGSGMRRGFPLCFGEANSRPEKGSEIEGIRVVGIEIIKPQDFGKYGGSNSGVAVYNLKVLGHPSYVLSNGEVVHNCQDQSLPQLTMMRRIVKADGRIVVVGDDRQAIYAFRGACSDGLDMMKTALGAAEAPLTTTYRCPKAVVALAAQIVPDYHAAPEAPDGTVEELNEAGMIERVKIGDAILSRVNAPLMPLCLGLLRKGIPARIEGRDIGRQLQGMVRKLNGKSVPDFLRKLDTWLSKQVKRALCSKKGADAKCDQLRDMADTLSAVAEGAASIGEIEKRLGDLFQDSDQCAKPAVVLSSTHKAKGLEYFRVFILRDTFRRNGGKRVMSPEESKQESNCYYVALTRSQNYLALVASGGQKTEQKN